MKDKLRQCNLFNGLDEAHISRLTALAERQMLETGEHLFQLGSTADRVFVVLEGTVELCLPLSIHGEVKEIAMESAGPGRALGWSAFVKPYRFRLSARAAGPAVVASFERKAVVRLIEEDPRFGCVFLSRVAEIIGQRLLTVQALWAREFQRAVTNASRPRPADASAGG